ncbi:MAG: hypothetical protein ACOYLB_09605 [Phototrophicaceae bacterium]
MSNRVEIESLYYAVKDTVDPILARPNMEQLIHIFMNPHTSQVERALIRQKVVGHINLIHHFNFAIEYIIEGDHPEIYCRRDLVRMAFFDGAGDPRDLALNLPTWIEAAKSSGINVQALIADYLNLYSSALRLLLTEQRLDLSLWFKD